MATKKKGTIKKTSTKSAAGVAKSQSTKKPEPQSKEKLRTFAIRVTSDELAAIHDAAGPRNASRFARSVMAAFAASDETAFRSVLTEAQSARADNA